VRFTTTILACFLLPLAAADLTVCASGCAYSTMQTAIDAANPGDTITLPAGATFASDPFTLKKKPGAEWITIRSSRAWLLPEDTRPSPTDSRLATITFSAANTALIALETDPSFSSDCWTAQAVGNTVTVGYLHGGTAGTCEARMKDGTLFSSSAPLGTVTLLGAAVPTAGTYGAQGTGLRVGLGTDGKLWINHKSDIVEGTHFTCTNCTTTGFTDSWIHFNFAADAIAICNIGYDTAGALTGVGDRRVWLVGPWAARTDEAGLYPGTYAAAYKGPANGVHHYRFDGIHFRYESTAESYYGMVFSKDTSVQYQHVPHHLEIDRCIFSQPKASPGFWRWIGIYHADGLTIKNSRFLNTQHRSEGQGIFVAGALGPVVLENNEIDGGTQSFIAGGYSSRIVAVPQVIARRNLFRKRLEQRPLIRIVRQASTDTLALTTTDSATRCNAGSCPDYYEDTLYTCTADSTVTIASGEAAKLYIGRSPAGVLTVGHNSGANVTCSGCFTCLDGVASRASMADYAMKYEWTAASGAWGSTYDWSFASGSDVLLKNLFELKMGREVLFEGNILRNYWDSGGQHHPLGFTPRNQNGQDVFVRIDGLTVRRNKLYNVHSGFYATGSDDMGGNTFGRGYRLEDNIFDLDKAAWGNSTLGGICASLGDGNLDVTMRRNTCASTVNGFYQNTAGTALNWLHTHDNLWLWSTAGAYSSSFAGQGLTAGWTNVRKSDWAITAYGYIGPTSTYRGNLNMSTSTITATGWNSWADAADLNFTGNQRAQSVTLTDQFASWASPLTDTTDLRLKSTSAYSAHCASGCDTQLVTQGGTDPGADWDLVETLTNGVNEGLAPLAKRLALRVHRDRTSATIELRYAGTATVQVGPYQSLKTADLVLNTSTPSGGTGGRQVFNVSGLTAGTFYWYRVSTPAGVVMDRM